MRGSAKHAVNGPRRSPVLAQKLSSRLPFDVLFLRGLNHSSLYLDVGGFFSLQPSSVPTVLTGHSSSNMEGHFGSSGPSLDPSRWQSVRSPR